MKLEDVTRAFTEINGSTQEISTGGQEILHAMSELNSISSEVNSGSGEMKIGTNSVAQALDKINQISIDVLQYVETTFQSAEDINTHMKSVSEENWQVASGRSEAL